MKVTIILDCWRGQANPARLQQALDSIAPWQFLGPSETAGDPAYGFLAKLFALSSARELAALLTDDQSGQYCYEATPCHWQISTSDVAFTPTPPPSLPECEALIECANDAFEGAARLQALSADLWSMRAPFDLACGSAAQTAGVSVRAALPTGDAGTAFKRALNAAQMAWFNHPVNLAREQRGLVPINAFWLMGGRVPKPSATASFDGVLRTGPRSERLARAAGLPLHDQPSGSMMLAWFTDGRDAVTHGTALQDASYEKLATLINALPRNAQVELVATGTADVVRATRQVARNPIVRWVAGFRDVSALSERLLT